AYTSDIGNLISPVAETEADTQILMALSVPIIDGDFDCSLKKSPGIATDWGWSDDGKILSLTLRNDLKFYDGKPLTAHDIAFTYQIVGDPKVGSPRLQFLQHMTPDGRPKVFDDHHLEFHFTHAYDRDTQTAHATTLSVLPKHLLQDADRSTIRGHALAKTPVSHGPFRMATHEPNERIVLVPNENFSGPEEMRPHLNRVIFRILPEYSTRLLELQSGNVDMFQGINIADADELRKTHPHINIVRRGWRFMDYVAWNASIPLFEDKRVRRGLTMAIDIDGMIAKLLTAKSGERYAKRAVSTITPELCGIHNDDVKLLPFDLEQSEALMAEAGWTDTDGDGILDKDGKKFEFTLATNTSNKRRADVSILIQANLEKLGVKANLEQQESNVFFKNLRERKYEAALAGWSTSLFVDPSDEWRSDSDGTHHEFNFTNYANPKADELIDKGMSIADIQQAAPVWKEFQQVVYDDQPYTFLWWMDELVAIDSRFENVEINVLSALNHLHRWEVPADKVKYKD
ncbi:MAG: hypothetical protein HN348_31585, partial [Proteobacteria bacterium]|nr:hypothetical protein [Pseudomonadota bacterium]